MGSPAPHGSASSLMFLVFKLTCLSSGLDAELYYVRNDVVSHYALSFTLPVPSDTNSLHFTWDSKAKVGLSSAYSP